MKILSILVATALVGCASTPKVTRTASGSTEGGDLSGYWNDIDAELTAKTLTGQLLDSPWIGDFRDESGRKPVIKLAGVVKRTDDRNVNTQFFGKQLERFLLNSGRVRVVAAKGQEDINVSERTRQSQQASDDSAKTQFNELGADFTLQTVINSQNESDGGGKAVRAYLVNMELLNVETNEKVWIGERKIRKAIERAKTRF
ncbi:MAG: penicillin-binding protein activator LpoB [Myxococcota bacterium]